MEHKRWKYFSEDELRCKGTGELKMMEEFMDKLILLRETIKQPLVNFLPKGCKLKLGSVFNNPCPFVRPVVKVRPSPLPLFLPFNIFL